MRRWLALLVGVAVLAVAGTALALNSVAPGSDEKSIAETPQSETVTTSAALAEAERRSPREPGEVKRELLEAEPDQPWEEPERSTPHKVAVDVAPPQIEILHPEDGQVFEKREVVFEGKTEPGADVYAGDLRAEVNEEGGWRIVLVLDSGTNEVTLKAVDAAGNTATDTVTVVYEAPKPKEEKPRVEEPKKEEPRSEEREEERHEKEEPRSEEPKEEHPKEEPPGDGEVHWEFSAHQVYGECDESPPFDVFHGTGKPGSLISVGSEFGGGTTEVGPKGGWEIKVIFEAAPVGQAFEVHIEDQFGNRKAFEFTRID